jgi:hypothetical protein
LSAFFDQLQIVMSTSGAQTNYAGGMINAADRARIFHAAQLVGDCPSNLGRALQRPQGPL